VCGRVRVSVCVCVRVCRVCLLRVSVRVEVCVRFRVCLMQRGQNLKKRVDGLQQCCEAATDCGREYAEVSLRVECSWCDYIVCGG